MDTIFPNPNSQIGATKKSRPAAKRKGRRRAAYLPKIQMPSFSSLLVGAVSGILLTLLVFVNFSDKDFNLKIPFKKREPTLTTAHTATKVHNKPKPKFEFYNELTKNQSQSPTTPLKTQPTPTYVYNVQAGSFKVRDDANALKAKLVLRGFSAHVDVVTLESGQAWHRVLVGPFRSEYQAKRQQMQLEGFKFRGTLVLKTRTN